MAYNGEGFALEITADVKGFNAKLAEARKNLEKFQREASNVKLGGVNGSGSSTGSANTLTASRTFTASLYTMGGAVDSVVRSLARFSASLNGGAVKAATAANSTRMASAMGNARGRSGMGAGGLLMALPGAAMVGALAAAPIYKGISEFGSREKLKTDFGTLLRDDQRGADMAQRIQKYAAATPYGQNDLAATAKTLLQYGANEGETEKYLKQLGDVALGNRQQMGSLGLVLGQVKSAGKLQGQDLLQFINAGWNPLTTLSEMTGRTVGDLREAASKGEITFDHIAMALEKATAEGGQFYKGAERGAKTLIGLFSTIQDNIGTALAKIIESQEPAIKSLAEKWANFDWSKVIKAGSAVFEIAVRGFQKISEGVQLVAGNAEVLKQVFIAMATAATVSAEMKLAETFGNLKQGLGELKNGVEGVGASALKTQVALMGVTWSLSQIIRAASAFKEWRDAENNAQNENEKSVARANATTLLASWHRKFLRGSIDEKGYKAKYDEAQRKVRENGGDLTGSNYDIWSKPESAARAEAKRGQTLVIDKSKKEIKQTNNIKVDESRFAKVVKENLEMLLSSQLRLDNDLASVQATAG